MSPLVHKNHDSEDKAYGYECYESVLQIDHESLTSIIQERTITREFDLDRFCRNKSPKCRVSSCATLPLLRERAVALQGPLRARLRSCSSLLEAYAREPFRLQPRCRETATCARGMPPPRF